ncbi:unnamed protein product [Amoebophrya sp. A25]|nr:unnamed protein product [Amoebophrya sp. A25]|eukprot:GSA25T00010333001.1
MSSNKKEGRDGKNDEAEDKDTMQRKVFLGPSSSSRYDLRKEDLEIPEKLKNTAIGEILFQADLAMKRHVFSLSALRKSGSSGRTSDEILTFHHIGRLRRDQKRQMLNESMADLGFTIPKNAEQLEAEGLASRHRFWFVVKEAYVREINIHDESESEKKSNTRLLVPYVKLGIETRALRTVRDPANPSRLITEDVPVPATCSTSSTASSKSSSSSSSSSSTEAACKSWTAQYAALASEKSDIYMESIPEIAELVQVTRAFVLAKYLLQNNIVKSSEIPRSAASGLVLSSKDYDHSGEVQITSENNGILARMKKELLSRAKVTQPAILENILAKVASKKRSREDESGGRRDDGKCLKDFLASTKGQNFLEERVLVEDCKFPVDYPMQMPLLKYTDPVPYHKVALPFGSSNTHLQLVGGVDLGFAGSRVSSLTSDFYFNTGSRGTGTGRGSTGGGTASSSGSGGGTSSGSGGENNGNNNGGRDPNEEQLLRDLYRLERQSRENMKNRDAHYWDDYRGDHLEELGQAPDLFSHWDWTTMFPR